MPARSPSPPPRRDSAASGPAGPDALDCAPDEASALGYVVDRAERGVYVRVRQGRHYRFGRSDTVLDVLTASAPRRRLTVAATGENAEGLAVEHAGRARRDAQAIVTASAA